MSKATKHFALPAIGPTLFFAAASVPVEVLGCRNRGLIAALLAIVSGILGILAAVRALAGRARGDDPDASLWMVSALILAVPALAIVVSAR